MGQEVTTNEMFTSWRVFYKWGSRLQKTAPMTPAECLKHFKKCYAVMYEGNGKFAGARK